MSLSKVWRWVQSHRWDLEQWAIFRGWYDLREGDYYRTGRWRFPWRNIPLDPQVARLIAHCKATGKPLPPLGF